MAAGPITQIVDGIVPETYAAYVQQITQEKSAVVQSGALIPSEMLNSQLAGPGLTWNTPSFRDLDNDEENISTDDADDKFTGQNNNSTPKKITSAREVNVRLSRNQSWSSADLTAAILGPCLLYTSDAADE